MAPRVVLSVWLASWAAVGCGARATAASDLARAACPSDLPSQCPTPAPTWNGGVGQLIATRCEPCHSKGGPAADKPLTDYASVSARRGTVLDEVYSCVMPPPRCRAARS